jgi:hypothetical protein
MPAITNAFDAVTTATVAQPLELVKQSPRQATVAAPAKSTAVQTSGEDSVSISRSAQLQSAAYARPAATAPPAAATAPSAAATARAPSAATATAPPAAATAPSAAAATATAPSPATATPTPIPQSIASQVQSLTTQGKSVEQIASALGITIAAVRGYLNEQ